LTAPVPYVTRVGVPPAVGTVNTSWPSLDAATYAMVPPSSESFGSFRTSERRGGVERRQLKLKGVEVCRD
jgi:hypothetical protein